MRLAQCCRSLARGRGFIFVAVWVVIARYLDWRIFTTVVPAAGEWYEVGWVYFCFATTHSSPA
jgi:hypothetical protein